MYKSLLSLVTGILGLVMIGFGCVDMVHGHYDRAAVDLVIVVIMKQSWDKP